MANSKTIGKLRVNLGLDNSEFQKGVKGVGPHVAQLRNQFLAVAGAAAAVGASLLTFARNGADVIDDTAKSARRLGASIGGFRALELAAGEAGVSLSSLTNDVQTIDREIASIGKSGNADRALKELKIDAEDLAGLDADEKLALIADQVKALGLTTGQTTSVLRDLGVRNREMTLLMVAGGDALRDARSDVEAYGLALSDVDVATIETANDNLGRLGLVSQYAGQQLALAVVPALGDMAKAMTDSLKAGGTLRMVIDGLVNNLERLGTYVSVIVTGFGVRYVGALAAARLANLSLAASFTFLRGALIRTGFLAIVVGAGELVYQFSRLVQATGSFGSALSMLGDVAAEVWTRMKTGAASLGASLSATWDTIQASFVSMLGTLQDKWATFLRNLAGSVKGVPGLEGMQLELFNQSVEARSGSYESQVTADALNASADAARARADALAQAATAPLESLKALKTVVSDARVETDGAADAVDRLNASLSEVDGQSGAAAGGAKRVSEAVKMTSDEMGNLKNSASSAFTGMVTGAKSASEAVADLLSSLANMFANRAFEMLWGGIKIPGFATGTSFAPGGMALVGERGPELVNLPRGSQVFSAGRTNQMMSGAGGGVHVSIGVDQTGNLLPVIERVSGDVSARAVQNGLTRYDREVLPGSIRRAQQDPRRIR